MQGRRFLMRAPQQVELETFELDETALNPGDILVRHDVNTISPGTELASFTGLAQESDTTSYGKYPFRPGYAAVGTVVATGPGTPRFPIGTRVLHSALHATFGVSRPAASVVPVPEGLASEDAVFARLAAISLTAVRLSAAEPGETVAVIGQGMIGNLAAQLFRATGVRVLVVDPNPARLALSAKCGISERLAEIGQVLEATQGVGAETVVDATGMPGPIATAIDVVARFGELILLGTPRGAPATPIDFTHFVARAHERTIRVQGAHASTSPPRDGTGLPRTPVRHSIEANLRYLFDAMLPNPPQLALAPVRTHSFPPENAQEAYSGLLEQPEQYMGVVFRWGV